MRDVVYPIPEPAVVLAHQLRYASDDRADRLWSDLELRYPSNAAQIWREACALIDQWAEEAEAS